MRQPSRFVRVRYAALFALLLGAEAGATGDVVPRTAPNALYVEVLGNGLLYSINYDRQLGESLSLRIGYGEWSSSGGFLDQDTQEETQMIPVMLKRPAGPEQSSV